jgi:hypothetical protein
MLAMELSVGTFIGLPAKGFVSAIISIAVTGLSIDRALWKPWKVKWC